MNKDKIGTLEDLFKDEIKDPFFYKLNLNESKNNKELFEKIQNIYKTGLMILFGDELSKTINIKNLSYRHIDKINKYMLSIGIKVQYNRLTNFELNKLYESFLFELENIDEIDILVTKNWKLDEISYRTGGPARYVKVRETGQRLGFITPLSHNFCEDCNRVRITCTGELYMCLGQNDRADLRTPLRKDSSNISVLSAIDEAIGRKPKGHDFIIERGVSKPAVERHMSVTGG